MPASIAAYMRDALAEDKFGHEFNAGIDARVFEMNAAQLQGVYQHLNKSAKMAKSSLWRNANREIIGHVEGLMRERVAVIDKAKAKQVEAEKKEAWSERLKELRKEENEKMIEAVQNNARTQAEQEITTAETQRKRQERSEIAVKAAWLEDARDKYWHKLGIFWFASSLTVTIGLSINAVSSLVQGLSGTIIGIYWGLCTLICGYLAYRKYRGAQVFPKLVTDDDLEEMISQREDEIREQLLDHMAEQKRKFKEAAAQEKIERRARKEEARIKKEYEEETQRQRLQEQEEAAAELMAQMLAAKNRVNGGSTIASNSLDASGKGHSPGGSRVHTPFKNPGAEPDEDNNSLALTVDAEFNNLFDGDESKFGGDEERMALLMPPLGSEGRNSALRFPVNEQGLLSLSVVKVDVSDLHWRFTSNTPAAQYLANTTAYRALQLQTDDANASSAGAMYAVDGVDNAEIFWSSAAKVVTCTTSISATNTTEAQPKPNSRTDSISKGMRAVFEPTHFSAASHHKASQASDTRQIPVERAHTYLGDSHRVVLRVALIPKVEDSSQDHLGDVDRMERGRTQESKSLDGGGAVVGVFEFLLKDVFQAWVEASDRDLQDDPKKVKAVSAGLGLCSCSCVPLTLRGVLLDDDFAAVGNVSVQLTLGMQCAAASK